MPRTADPNTGSEILDAASRLLEVHGRTGVTMRAVAKEARVAVTTVYERFPGRDELLHELAVYLVRREAPRFRKLKRIEDLLAAYVGYARAHPHTYEFMADSFAERLVTGGPVPVYDLSKKMLAEQLGGTPEEHSDLAFGTLEVMAGTVRIILAARHNRAEQRRALRAASVILNCVLNNPPTAVARPVAPPSRS